MKRRSFAMVAIAAFASTVEIPSSLQASANWPLWEAYTARFLDASGRIVDHDDHDRTTSEAQAYALFFALACNDQTRFARLLSWTEQNLAHGRLASNLPAWLWGNQHGSWGVQDENSASDADLWIAYTLLEAGRLWEEPRYKTLGAALCHRILEAEVKDIPGLGPMLMPGPSGFVTGDGFYQLNASYLPVQLFLGISHHVPHPSWRRIAELTPRVVQGSSPAGFVLDWIAFRSDQGFSTDPVPPREPLASYDAIRVYLWAGMLAPSVSYHQKLLEACHGMADYLSSHATPPAEVKPNGTIKDPRGNPGFSAAVMPLLSALRQTSALDEQEHRLSLAKNATTGLYGSPPRYYDQNLALFATGWMEGRFRFHPQGLLQVSWR
jgi:endoglucanase